MVGSSLPKYNLIFQSLSMKFKCHTTLVTTINKHPHTYDKKCITVTATLSNLYRFKVYMKISNKILFLIMKLKIQYASTEGRGKMDCQIF